MTILCKTSTKCLSTYGAQESVTAQHYVMLCLTKKCRARGQFMIIRYSSHCFSLRPATFGSCS